MQALQRVAFGLVALGLAAGWTLVAAAQSATPIPGLPRADIAAMTLVPGDLPDPGYGLEGGTRLTLAEEAAGVVAYRGGESVAGTVAAFQERLSAVGWLERYTSALALPNRDDPTIVDRRIVTYVTLYTDLTGAAEGFGLLEDESTVANATDIPGTRSIAEQSEITRSTGILSGSDLPYQSLDLTFRTGSLTAGVLIYDNRNIPPEVAEIEALADRLLGRVQDVLSTGGPGLGARALRLAGPPARIPFHDELYELKNDGIIPYLGEEPDVIASREVQYGTATDVYSVYQALVAGDDEPDDDPYVVVRLYRFPDASSAANWLAGLADNLRGQSDEYPEVTTLVGGLTGAEESVSLGYTYNATDTLVTRGFLIAMRAGPIVARIQVDGLPQPPIAAVQEMAEAQARCLSDPSGGTCTTAFPIPTSLLPELPPEPELPPVMPDMVPTD